MGGGTGGEGQIDGARRWCRNATAKSASNGTMKRVLPEHHFVTSSDLAEHRSDDQLQPLVEGLALVSIKQEGIKVRAAWVGVGGRWA